MKDIGNQSPVHVIRLRGPAWLIHEEKGEQKRTRVKTPCEIDPGLESQCTVQRNIGGPTGTDANQRIELAFSGFKKVKAVLFNDQPLRLELTEQESEICVDVTGLVKTHNQIAIHFSPPAYFGDLEMRIIG